MESRPRLFGRCWWGVVGCAVGAAGIDCGFDIGLEVGTGLGAGSDRGAGIDRGADRVAALDADWILDSSLKTALECRCDQYISSRRW